MANSNSRVLLEGSFRAKAEHIKKAKVSPISVFLSCHLMVGGVLCQRPCSGQAAADLTEQGQVLNHFAPNEALASDKALSFTNKLKEQVCTLVFWMNTMSIHSPKIQNPKYFKNLNSFEHRRPQIGSFTGGLVTLNKSTWNWLQLCL